MDNKLVELLQFSNPWIMCTSVGVDNTSVNIGVRDSLKTRVLNSNPAIYFNGCPCHIIHNAAQKAGDISWSVAGLMWRNLPLTSTIGLISRPNERMGFDHTVLSVIKITEQ